MKSVSALALVILGVYLPTSHASWEDKYRAMEPGRHGGDRLRSPNQCLDAGKQWESSSVNPLIWFVHIPKTGGTTMSMKMAVSYTKYRILPGSGVSCGYHEKEPTEESEQEYRHSNVAFSHNIWHSVKTFGERHNREVAPISIIRDTLTQRQSYFHEKVRDIVPNCDNCEDPECSNCNGDTFKTPSEWLASSHYRKFMQSYQVGKLASEGLQEFRTLIKQTAGQKMLGLSASSNVCNMAFIGITEKMDETACLYSYKFQTKLAQLPSYRVKSYNYVEEDGWDADVNSKLLKMEKSEVALVDYAKKVFNERLEAAKADIKRRKDNGEDMPWVCNEWRTEIGMEKADQALMSDSKLKRIVDDKDVGCHSNVTWINTAK